MVKAATIKGRTGSVLVIETDELTLRAALCSRSTDGVLRIASCCTSHQVDLAAAVRDVSDQLRARNVRPPARAVLLSPQVQSAILQLPVNPQTPLPFRQMQELVRWELEPYLAQTRVRRIGAILVGRGHLRWLDLETLLSHMDELSRDGSAPRRLGELAVQFGMITPAQLDECLAIQRGGSQESSAGELACGWSPLGSESRDGKWGWLVCGTSRAYRELAAAAFRTAGLKLDAAYPLVGCAFAALNGALTNGAAAVLDYQHGYLACSRFDDRRMVSHRVLFTHEPGNPLEAAADALDSHADAVWLAGRWPDLAAATREIAGCASAACQPIDLAPGLLPAEGEDAPAMAGIRGAARHYFVAGDDAAVISAVPARDPRPSLLTDRRALAVAASLLLTALLVALAVWMRHAAQADVAAWQTQRSLDTRQAQIFALRKQGTQLESDIDFLRRVLPDRQRLVPGLLTALESSCPDGIVIRRLAETPRGEIVVAGWGASPQEIQHFKILLQEQLIGLLVGDDMKPIQQEPAGRGAAAPGFTFELRLVASQPARGGAR